MNSSTSTSSKPKRKRVVVSFEKKVEAIKRVQKGELMRVVAADYGVSRNTISDWMKDREKIEKNFMLFSDGAATKKSTKTTTFSKTGEALYMWFCLRRQVGVPISGVILQAKAKILSQQFPDENKNFAASNGWLNRWKKRYGIRQVTVCGEKLSANEDAVDPFRENLLDFIWKKKYTLDQIFNADETGLNYKMLPSKTLAVKTEISAPGAKKSKERVTIMTCANASGSFRLPLMLIGKSARPRALKDMDF